jgi:catechol 2,3-dioxygenase-like lactoylglutathione lyase family enzyme
MTFTFHHIHLRSPDPVATGEFYRRMFGATIEQTVYPAGSPYAGLPKIAMTVGGQRVLIHPGHPKQPTGAAPQAPNFGLEHIGLTVEDLDASAAELERRGAEFWRKPEKTATGNRNAFVRGPQGVLIELIEPGSEGQ